MFWGAQGGVLESCLFPYACSVAFALLGQPLILQGPHILVISG